jgi:hypothetical protein
MYNESRGMVSTGQSMNNNNTSRRKKKYKEKKDFSVDNKVPKEQKTTTTKADVMDMSAGIIDIDDTPDVATWNKKINIKGDAAGIIANRLHKAEIRPPTTIGIGLREKKRSKKDLIIDPANKKEVDEGIKSGLTFTDEADDLS